MIVEDMERHFFELKGRLDVGVVTEEQFKAEVQKLRFQDKQGRWWMLGAQSGKWYAYDGARWIPGQPPTDVPSPTAPPCPPDAPGEKPTPNPDLPDAAWIPRKCIPALSNPAQEFSPRRG